MFLGIVKLKNTNSDQKGMGRIKTRLIKRTAKKLMSDDESRFGTEFVSPLEVTVIYVLKET